MNESTPSAATQRESLPAKKPPTDTRPRPARAASIIVGLVIAAVAGLSIWYLVRPEPLLVQGEVDATRFDIAARVDGKVGEIPVERGQNVAAGAVLVKIDNPETIAKHEHGNAPQARLDQATDSLHENQRAVDQAKSAYEQAVNGYTKEEREIAVANVQKAIADIAAVQSIIDQMVVYAPVPSQVYKRNVEPGEYVSPGVPLVTLIDLNDLWVHFDLREDLVKALKVGDRFAVRIPALADRRITVEVRLIATKGEYASWRATRATGDFDLRTFSIRAYPVEKVPELRPGMSAYVDWQQRQ
jgi:HlyD family secretion protein